MSAITKSLATLFHIQFVGNGIIRAKIHESFTTTERRRTTPMILAGLSVPVCVAVVADSE